MTNTKETKQNKRFRPVRIVLYLIALCIVVALVKTFLIPPPKPNIAINYVEKLNQLTKPQNYNPAENAATLYEQAFKEFKQMPRELEEIIDQWEWSNRKWLWPGDLEPDELKQLRDWLKSNKKAFELVALAVEKPYLWVPASEPDNILLGVKRDHLTLAGEISKAMCLQAKISAMNGDMQSAIVDFRVMQKLSNHIDRKPVVTIEHLIARGIRGLVYNSILLCLAHTEIDNLALNQLQTDLNELSVSISAALASFEFALETEKMMIEDSVQRYFTDNGKGDGYVIFDIWEKEFELFSLRTLPLNHYSKSLNGKINYLKGKLGYFKKRGEIISQFESRKITLNKLDKYYDAIRNASKYSPGQLHSQGSSYQTKIDMAVNTSDNYFLNRMAYVYRRLPNLMYRHQAINKALITTIEIFRYEKNTGNYPQTLDQLIEDRYLESLPMDPYSDKQFLYKRTDDNFILYSCGEDFDDDGGTKQYSRKEKDGDFIFWPIPKPKKKPPVAPSTMSGIPIMPGMPGMMLLPEQPPMDPNMIT